MSILAANLRQLYRPRALFLAWILAGCFAFAAVAMPLDEPVAGQGRFIGLVALAFVVGILMASIQMEILTKPFAFSLPGHRRIVRRLIFWTAVMSNAVGCLLFLLYPGVPAGYVPVILASAFCAGLAFYLAGVWLGFSSGQPLAFIGLIVFVAFGGQMLELHVLLEKAIVEAPLAVIALGLVAAGAVWRYLGDENLVRKNCLRPWIGFGAAFDPQEAQRIRERSANARYWKQKLKDHPHRWVQEWFIAAMNRKKPLTTARFVWGSLYANFAITFSQWKSILLFVPFVALLLGYTGGRLWLVMLVGPMMMAMQGRPALYSNMLPLGGRYQRFVATLSAAAVGTALLTLFVTLTVLVSISLAAVAPDIAYKGLNLRYQSVGPAIFGVVVLLPLMYALRLIFFRNPAGMMGVSMMLICGLMFPWMMPRPHRGPLIEIGPSDATVLTLLLWVIYIAVVCHIARSRSLVR